MEVFTFFAIIGALYIAYRFFDSKRRALKLDSFSSRYILITGCDTGFGNECAKRLDKLGCHVFAGCLTEKGEDDLKKSCSEKLVTVPLDVADHESVLKAFEIVTEKLPAGKGLWGIVNNAGIAGNNVPIEWLQISDYQKVLDINTLGMVDVSTVFLPLIKHEKGRIVNTTSMAGRIGPAGMAPYTISKFAAEAFSDSLRRQMKVFGVSVHIIEPGFFRTNIVDIEKTIQMYRDAFARAPKEAQEEYGKQYVDKVEENIKQGVPKMNQNISQVVDAYEHALLGQHPRARYVVGTDAHLVFVPVSLLPTAIGDFILSVVTRKHRAIPQACK